MRNWMILTTKILLFFFREFLTHLLWKLGGMDEECLTRKLTQQNSFCALLLCPAPNLKGKKASERNKKEFLLFCCYVCLAGIRAFLCEEKWAKICIHNEKKNKWSVFLYKLNSSYGILYSTIYRSQKLDKNYQKALCNKWMRSVVSLALDPAAGVAPQQELSRLVVAEDQDGEGDGRQPPVDLQGVHPQALVHAGRVG